MGRGRRGEFDLRGTCLSSGSAPWLQASMIRQADAQPVKNDHLPTRTHSAGTPC
jgi:hypothetical protein